MRCYDKDDPLLSFLGSPNSLWQFSQIHLPVVLIFAFGHSGQGVWFRANAHGNTQVWLTCDNSGEGRSSNVQNTWCVQKADEALIWLCYIRPEKQVLDGVFCHKAKIRLRGTLASWPDEGKGAAVPCLGLQLTGWSWFSAWLCWWFLRSRKDISPAFSRSCSILANISSFQED
jgi:hypothetical protein